MTTPNVQVRRATIEDLPKLSALWKEENLPWADLEKRFKEFQVVESATGEILGAVGLQIMGLEGRLHSEVFARPEEADSARDKLWERAQILARNHGLVRIWTQLATPFWHTNGFQFVSQELLVKLPGVFTGDSHPWLFLQLREEPTGAPASIDKEFAVFKEAEQERTQQMFRKARVLKIIAGVMAVIVLFLVVIWAISFFKLQARMTPR